MMNIYKRYISFALFLSIVSTLLANKPLVVNFSKQDYKADNKNWAIGQDDMGVMYFGNDVGLLEFHGVDWKLHKAPHGQVVRSLHVQSNKTIFTGGYEEFGRWDRDVSGSLVYTSLSKDISTSRFKNGDFWKIIELDGRVYFQSFYSLFVYDYNTVKQIDLSHSYLFLSKVRDELIIQQMGGPLYNIVDDKEVLVKGSEIFEGTDVRVILPYGTDQYLIGTTTKGVYIYDGISFREWNKKLSGILNMHEINCGIYSSRGTYYFGTILGGIYVVDKEGNILHHIASESNLQNNTVLSIYEDKSGCIWSGLDRGISYLNYEANISFYTDPTGNTGAIYSAIMWNDKLVIGTNQGAYYIYRSELELPNALSKMRLIKGSEGQVWTLKIVDGKLYCGHNRGFRMISPNMTVLELANFAGVFEITEYTGQPTKLLLSSYNSVEIFDKVSGDCYMLEGMQEPIMDTQIDHLGNIWLEHASKGVYRCRLSQDSKRIITLAYYGGNGEDGLPYKMKIFKVGGRLEFLGDNKFFTYDDVNNRVVENKTLNACFSSVNDIRQIVHISDNHYWALGTSSVYLFYYDGYEAKLIDNYDAEKHGLSLINNYENVSVLSSSISLICLDNGFLLYNTTNDNRSILKELPKPYFNSFATKESKGNGAYYSLDKDISIPNNYNSVDISFAAKDVFSSNLFFQYMLVGFEDEWSDVQKINTISYARLPEGDYELLVRTVDAVGNHSDISSLRFSIQPPWYQSIWAYGLYLFIFSGIVYGTWSLILRRYRNVHLRKIRARETKRLQVLAGKLQREVEAKNAEMLTQASFIIQRNELIQSLKDLVDDFYVQHGTKSLVPLQQKITALLNHNLDSEDDWKMFLIKFEEKHTGFFKKIKTLYPSLTVSDLRLCACLKLNLETKEIASLMNLSVRAVENNRYRLRKKLNIESNQNLNEFVLSID